MALVSGKDSIGCDSLTIAELIELLELAAKNASRQQNDDKFDFQYVGDLFASMELLKEAMNIIKKFIFNQVIANRTIKVLTQVIQNFFVQ